MVHLEAGSVSGCLEEEHISAIAAGTGPDGRDFVAVVGKGASSELVPTRITVWIDVPARIREDVDDPVGENEHRARPVRLKGHNKPIYALATSAGRLASGSDDQQIKLWNPFTEPQSRLLAVINTGAKVWALAMCGELLISGGAGNAVSNINVWCLRDVPTFSETNLQPAHLARQPVRLASLRGFDGSVRSLAFDGDRVVAGTDIGIVYVWHHAGLPIATETAGDAV